MGLLSGYRPLVKRIGSFRLPGNGKRRPAVTKTLSTLSTNQLLLLKDTGSQADDSLHGQRKYDHGESHSGGDSSTGSSRPRNDDAAMEGKNGSGGEAPAASCSTEEESLRTARSGEEGNNSAFSSSPLSSRDRRKEEVNEQEQELEWRRLGSADFPGSPSFREYCHISISDADDSGEDGDYMITDDEPSHQRKGNMDSTTSTTTDQGKALPPAAKDRFKRLRLLTRAPIAMFNVRSCYDRSSS